MTLTLEPMGIVLVQVILSSSVRRFSFPQLWRLFEMFSAKVLIRPSCSWGEISGLHLSEALCFHSWSNHLIVDLIRPALWECFFFFKDHKLCHHAPSGLLVLLRSSVHLFFLQNAQGGKVLSLWKVYLSFWASTSLYFFLHLHWHLFGMLYPLQILCLLYLSW